MVEFRDISSEIFKSEAVLNMFTEVRYGALGVVFFSFVHLGKIIYLIFEQLTVGCCFDDFSMMQDFICFLQFQHSGRKLFKVKGFIDKFKIMASQSTVNCF